MKLRFLKNNISNRKYDYNPMYYDERKERLEAKKKQFAKLENGEMSEAERISILRQNIRGEWSRSETRQKGRSSANLRTILLVVIIFALGYFIFFGVDQVETIVNNLW